MKVSSEIESILDKALQKEISRKEALELMKIDENSSEMYALASVANTLTRRQFNGRGEVYAQIGINLYPCPKSCEFCTFGEKWTQFDERYEFSEEEVLARAKEFEDAGANAIFLMSTADYSFEKYISLAKKVRDSLATDLPLVANIGDFGPEEADRLHGAGFQGVYHVCRLREGEDTEIDSEDRISTLETIQDSDLDLSYCVEPIGPEHSPEELVEEMFRGREHGAINHACMWRIPPPGGPKAEIEKISQLELAKVIAVTRLVARDTIRAMGVHEARAIPLLGGANQIYAETGPNPRDTVEETSEGRGYLVKDCKNLLKEAGYKPLEGPTDVFRFS